MLVVSCTQTSPGGRCWEKRREGEGRLTYSKPEARKKGDTATLGDSSRDADDPTAIVNHVWYSPILIRIYLLFMSKQRKESRFHRNAPLNRYKGAITLPYYAHTPCITKQRLSGATGRKRYVCVSLDKTVGTEDTGISPTSVTTAVI
jgi:hypothetical protein